MIPDSGQSKLSPTALLGLASAQDVRTRRLLLQDNGLLLPEVVLELNAATQKEFRINTDKALRLAESAVFVARTIRRQDLLAQSYRIKANVLVASGNYRTAIALYKSALASFEELNDADGAARTLMAIIQPRIMLGEYKAAFEAAQHAKRLLMKLNDKRRLARLENNIGNIFHRQDRFSEALAHYERAHRSLLAFGDSEELTIALNNMSMCLIAMNDFSRALNTYQRAKRLLIKRDLPLIGLITDYNIAYLRYLRGDYHQAIEMLKKSREGAERVGYGYLIALCQLDLSDIYVELNLCADAQEVAHDGYERFDGLAIRYEAAKALTNEAIALGQSGDVEMALQLFAQARALFVLEENPVWPWLIDLYCATVLVEQGRSLEARSLALNAMKRFRGKALRGKAALCQLILAQVALKTGRLDEALSWCRRALRVLKIFDSPILQFEALFLYAEVVRSRNKPRDAYRAYQRARRPLENLRSSLARDELKISFMKHKTKLYERLVGLCLAGPTGEKSIREAFGYIELAKSRSLAESLSRYNQTLTESPTDTSGRTEQRLRHLRQTLSWYQHRIESEQLKPDSNSDKRIQALQLKAHATEKRLLASLRDASDAEAKPFALPSKISLDRIMSSLQQAETVLEYFVADGQLLAVVVNEKSIEIVPLTNLQKIANTLRLLRFQLGKLQLPPGSNSESPAGNQGATLEHLSELYQELIAPVRRHFGGGHLTVIPHGILHQLPFHALYDGRNYLIDLHTISYAPSASIYMLCRSEKAQKGWGALVVGVPDDRAPFIQAEAELLRNVLRDSELLLGAAAGRETFFARAPSKHLIHVASHGNFRPDNPMFSGFRLSDGYVYLYELCRLRLRAELLTLSGCSTGLNAIAEGDELIGLIRGALFAGARSLLLSLWDVSDRTTATFMAAFYERLTEGKSKAAALKLAALQLRATHPHPYHWAPFMLVGNALNGIQ